MSSGGPNAATTSSRVMPMHTRDSNSSGDMGALRLQNGLSRPRGHLSYGRVCFPDRPQLPRQTHDQQKSRGWNDHHRRPEAKIVIEKGDGSPHPYALRPSVFHLRDLITNKGRKWSKCDGDYQNHAPKGAYALIQR